MSMQEGIGYREISGGMGLRMRSYPKNGFRMQSLIALNAGIDLMASSSVKRSRSRREVLHALRRDRRRILAKVISDRKKELK